MIEFKNVKLNISNIDILNEVSFTIADNSAVCLLGNRNTGKTSILKLLSRVHNNYYGEILIDSVYLEESKKKISMVFDKREKDTHLNVEEYLLFYGALCGKGKNELEIYIDNMLKLFSLISYKYTDMELLDNECYKFVQLIRAMINDPDILLLDNIYLDDNVDFNDKLNAYFKKLHGKKTMIFASRSLKNVENICDKIGILEGGNLIAYGDKEAVYRQAELAKRIEIELYDGMQEALNILKEDNNISNIIFEKNKIIFSSSGDEKSSNEILKKLMDNNIKVYSFRKENVTFEQIIGKLKDYSYAKY